MIQDTARTLFLAVPGTENIRELDLPSVRAAVARGEIGLDNWAWSPARNQWVPLAQVPEVADPYAPGTAQPAPSTETIAFSAPRVVVRAPVAGAASWPAAAHACANGRRGPHPATYYSKPIEEPREFPFFKILFFVLGVFIVATVLVNYFLVDKPFREAMSQTPFAEVQTYAHLAAFVQPSVLLIHVRPSHDITSDNLADLLIALARSAPREAVPGRPFNTISLTTAWLGHYAITAQDWAGLADLGGFTPEQKREFVLTHLDYITGAPIYQDRHHATIAARTIEEDKAWNALVIRFRGV